MKNISAICIVALFLFACNEKKSNQEVKNMRIVEDFNKNWSFGVDSLDIGAKDNWFIKGLPSSLKQEIKVPHTYSIEKGLERYFGTIWYEKNFDAPLNWEGKSIRLKFGAINRNAILFLNGKKIQEHIGAGYTTFYVNIGKHLKFGETNHLSIQIDNKFTTASIPYDKSFDWANDGGIYRDVSLIVSDKNAVDYLHVTPTFAKTANRYNGALDLKIKMLRHTDSLSQRMSFRLKVPEENQDTQKTIFEEFIKVHKSNEYYKGNINLQNINLWHFDHPNLYEVILESFIDDKQIDTYKTIIGFKKTEVREGEFFLNDESVRLSGIEWMPGSNPAYGFAEGEQEIGKMLTFIKESNSVFIRFHWQQDEKVIDWCNRNGLLVQEEIPHWQQPNEMTPSVEQSIKHHIDEMIVRDYNAPCIFSWGIGNELDGQSEVVYSFLEKTKDYVKSLDSKRLVSYTSSTLHINPYKDAAQIGDFLMWNDYQGTWHSKTTDSIGILLEEIHQAHPEKPIVISEFGLCEPQFKGGDTRRIKDMKTHIDHYTPRDFVAGAIYFSLNDYRTHMGEGGKGKYRQRVHGIVDLEGNPKPSYEFLKEYWSPIEIENIEYKNEKVILSLRCKSTLPSYKLVGYSIATIEVKDGVEKIVDVKEIQNINPKEKVVVELRKGNIIVLRRSGGSIVKKVKYRFLGRYIKENTNVEIVPLSEKKMLLVKSLKIKIAQMKSTFFIGF